MLDSSEMYVEVVSWGSGEVKGETSSPFIPLLLALRKSDEQWRSVTPYSAVHMFTADKIYLMAIFSFDAGVSPTWYLYNFDGQKTVH